MLDVFGTKKFVPVSLKYLESITAIVKSAKERGFLE